MKMLLRAALALSAAALCAPAMASQDSNAALALAQIKILQAQLAAMGGSSATAPLNVSAIGRDSAGRVNAFTSSGTVYTVTYDSFGPATITGGGKTTTVQRNAQGAVTGISTQ